MAYSNHSHEDLVKLLDKREAKWKSAMTENQALKATIFNLSSAVEKISNTNATLVSQNADLQQKVADLESSARKSQNSANAYGSPPSYLNIQSTILKAVNDMDQAKEKRLRAVLERVPEAENEIDTIANDKKLIQCIVDKANIKDLDIEKIHRHGKSQTGKPRIIKVPFLSQEARDLFIRNCRKVVTSNPEMPQKVSVRRDMTPLELEILYANRRSCYERNTQCGALRYYTRDLEIAENANPRPLQKRNA